MDGELFERIRAHVESSVTKERYAHSLRTGEFARVMCERYGLDGATGYVAGVAHDMCKDCGDDELLTLAARDGGEITTLERAKPSLLHGRAAAVVLREKYGVTDDALLQAVACHTFGGEHLCPLAKILFAADKIEPGRPQSTEKCRMHLLTLPLDELVLSVLEENIGYLRSRGKQVAYAQIAFRDELRATLRLPPTSGTREATA